MAMTADDVVGIQPFDEMVAGVPGLTFGYIGNCGPSYDDRTFCVWTTKREGPHNNLVELWSGDKLTRRAACEARKMVDAYKLGLEFAKQS